jgi:DNA-directed RNA polymerase specialized sigma24 family protein
MVAVKSKMRTAYQVTAKRWRKGWELHVPGVGVTQSDTLATAEGMVRDYLAITFDAYDTVQKVHVTIEPDLGEDLNARLEKARTLTRQAEKARDEAAADYRQLVTALREDGMSGAEIARVLKVSPQRVSQLLAA